MRHRNNPIVLAPGDSFRFSYTTTLTQNAGTSLTNVVDVTGHDDEDDTATAEAQHTVTFYATAAIDIGCEEVDRLVAGVRHAIDFFGGA